MPRDVEFNYTASDKTGPASESVTRRMKQTGDKVKKDNDKLSSDFAKGIVKLATSVSPKLGAAVTRGFQSAAEAAPQLIAGGIAAAAPLAGSLISAGIIGGIGLGGIVGGVAIAAKDPRVQASFAGMKRQISTELEDAATPFVQTSIDGIDAIGAAVKTVDFDAIFAKSAQNARPVIAGIASAVRDLGNGVESVIANSGPVLDQLGDSIAELGQHTASFLQTIGGGSEGAAAGLRDVTSALDTTLDVLGPTIRGLTEVYGWLSKVGAAKSFFVGLTGPIGQAADLLEQTGIIGQHSSGALKLVQKGVTDLSTATVNGIPVLDQYGQTILSDGNAIQSYTDKVDAMAHAGQSAFDAQTKVGEAIDRATKSAKENGKTLDANTVKGRANRDSLSAIASALQNKYDVEVQANGESAKSASIATSNRATFLRLAAQFGVTGKAAQDLANKMLGIPPKKDIKVNANTHDAAARVQALKEQLNALHSRSVSVIVNASVSKKVQNTLDRFGGTFSAQAGGFAFAGAGRIVEPARSLQVDSTIQNTISLDGRPFRSYTDRAVGAASKRDAWRQRVGKR